MEEQEPLSSPQLFRRYVHLDLSSILSVSLIPFVSLSQGSDRITHAYLVDSVPNDIWSPARPGREGAPCVSGLQNGSVAALRSNISSLSSCFDSPVAQFLSFPRPTRETSTHRQRQRILDRHCRSPRLMSSPRTTSYLPNFRLPLFSFLFNSFHNLLSASFQEIQEFGLLDGGAHCLQSGDSVTARTC